MMCLFILSWVTSILGVTSFMLSPSVDSIPLFFNGTVCGSFVSLSSEEDEGVLS